MFITFEKVQETKRIVVGVNINHVVKVEPGPPSSRNEQTTRIYYTNGENDVVTGQLQETIERLAGDAEVTSLG